MQASVVPDQLLQAFAGCALEGGGSPEATRFLAIPFAIEDSAVHRLLKMDASVVVVLKAAADGSPIMDDARVIDWWARDYGRLAATSPPARFHVLGGLQHIGIRDLLALARSMIPTVTTFDPLTHRVRSYGTRGLLIRFGLKLLPVRFRARLVPVLDRIPGLRGLIRRFGLYAWRQERLMTRCLHAGAPFHLPRDQWQAQRVLYVIGSLGPGGAERQLVNTVLGVKRLGGFDPIVICQDLSVPAGRFFLADLEDDAIRVHDLFAETRSLSGKSRSAALALDAMLMRMPGHYRETILEILDLIYRLRPTTVHCFLDSTNITGGTAAVIAGVPQVLLSTRSCAPTHFPFFEDYFRPHYRALLRQPRIRLLNNSHAGAADYRAWLGLGDLKIGVVHNGVASDENRRGARAAGRALRQEIGIPDEALVMGSAVRLVPEKGPVLWTRVAAGVAKSLDRVHFVLAGDGPLEAEVSKIAADAGITSRVHLIGRMRDIHPFMAALDVFVLTSPIEGLPNVLLEAQLMGVPVVTAPAGGAAEALDHGKTGLVSGNHSTEQLVECCVRILRDSELRRNLSRAAPDFVMEKFGLERMIQETIALYE